MKIQIRRFKVTVHHGVAPGAKFDSYNVIVEQPTPDEAFAMIRHDHKLPTGVKMTAKEIHSRFIETEERCND